MVEYYSLAKFQWSEVVDYNQPLVGGLSVHFTSARQIGNVPWAGGSTILLLYYTYLPWPLAGRRRPAWEGAREA
eukprot:4376916-Prymnesium_polylepis.1